MATGLTQPGPVASWLSWPRAVLAAAVLVAAFALDRLLGGWWDLATKGALAGVLIAAAARGSTPARHLLATVACAAGGFLLFLALLAAWS